ncbi:MAG: GNAT family N-acetyltransferase [Desulfurococcales archaeon]|nr:GNAT family N-acetyltransferase [Desulfurococcales archaeon]
MYEPGIVVRRPVREDVEALAGLILRFYRFNEEFDPAWSLTGDAENAARRLAEQYVSGGSGVTLVAAREHALVGYVRAVLRENPMLASKMGVITELYVVPSYRRQGIAGSLLDNASRELAGLGADYIAAEFPTANYVAESFYRDRKFRPFLSVYLQEV